MAIACRKDPGAAGGRNLNRAARGSVVMPVQKIVPKKQEVSA
jgi:hypothetical protein